ncbi:hypothetical protein ACHAAC_13225 [Aeromicrobium sp. CF4.19]|uniref:hypothetical protein n=1 Tax=Aeromicrobium sp. CF4.19 TaxID=3373082 RepID=UPI003EE7C9B7
MGWRGVAGLVVMIVATTGCGGPADRDDGSPSATTPSPSPSGAVPSSGGERPDPTLKPSAPSTQVRLSGVVRRSPEERSIVLEARAGAGRSARTWVLIGAVGGLVDGAEVTVVGRPDPGATTTGQRGPVFVVDQVEVR